MEITMKSRCPLEEDLIVEILSRLPVKSLMRFRCVSKEWYSLTRNYYLINTHLRRSDSSNLSLLTYTTDRDEPEFGISMLLGDEAAELVSIDLSFLNNYTCFVSVKLVGSSNGLVCLVTEAHKNGANKSMDDVEIIIWNPATRQLRTIPKPALAENISYISYTDAVTFGFGFSDHMTNDYKLVGIFNKQVQVFTRSTSCWRQVEGKGFPSYKYCFTYDWISLNGMLYWMRSAMTDRPLEFYILSFNLRNDAFDVMQLPSRDVWNPRLLPWKNSLACIIGDDLVWAKTTDDSGESTGENTRLPWTKQFSIDSSRFSGCGQILGIWKDQVLTQSSFGLWLYDLKTKKRVKWLTKPEAKNCYAKLVDYVESLVLV